MFTTMAASIESPLSPLLVARDAAALCGVGLSTWWRYHASGKIPAPVKIGGAVRWRREELYSWMDAGCPPREKWAPARKGA